MEATKRRRDCYDNAVDYLTANPGDIQHAWVDPEAHEAGCLFRFTTPTGKHDSKNPCGCLTQVRAGVWDAYDDGMTEAIKADDRIPANENCITVEHLPVFAEWQRKLDKFFHRT